MINNLLPCPFCGGRPTVFFPQDGFPEILCRNCYQAGTTLTQSTMAEAIAAWNTRAERMSHTHDELLAEMRAINDEWAQERTCCMDYNAAWSGDEIYPTEAYTCSLCGCTTLDGKPVYCPNCGAKVVS